MEQQAEYITSNETTKPWRCPACGEILGSIKSGSLIIKGPLGKITIVGDARIECKCGGVSNWEYRRPRKNIPQFIEDMYETRSKNRREMAEAWENDKACIEKQREISNEKAS